MSKNAIAMIRAGEVLTPSQVAYIYGITPRAVQKAAKEGRLTGDEYTEISSCYLITRAGAARVWGGKEDMLISIKDKRKGHEPMKYEKTDFEEMIRDWRADNAPEYDDLEITEIEKEGRQWIAYAQDEKTAYTLTDDGQGNIIINYSGTR